MSARFLACIAAEITPEVVWSTKPSSSENHMCQDLSASRVPACLSRGTSRDTRSLGIIGVSQCLRHTVDRVGLSSGHLLLIALEAGKLNIWFLPSLSSCWLADTLVSPHIYVFYKDRISLWPSRWPLKLPKAIPLVVQKWEIEFQVGEHEHSVRAFSWFARSALPEISDFSHRVKSGQDPS